ncbi:DUF1616 domain-containing protein [Chloroflexota bacterium]
MHPVLIVVLSALATWFLLALMLFLEKWEWEHGIEFHLKIPGWGGSVWDRVLSITLVLAILGALGMLVYVVAKPIEEKFTEFYVLSLNGESKDYPSRLMAGEEGEVVVGIINREGEAATYRVEVRIDGVMSSEVGAVTLEHGEKWEEAVGFTPDRAGDKQKVEFLLYRQAESEVYQRLHLTVHAQ